MSLFPPSDQLDELSARGGPVFTDSIGAELLTTIASATAHILERYDALEFASEAILRHRAVLTIGLERGAARLDGSLEPDQRRPRTVLVPLATLDRDGRGAPHVRDETGRIVPLLTSRQVQELLGSGLVAFASRALAGHDEMTVGIERLLRRAPADAVRRDRQDGDSQSDQSWDDEVFAETVVAELAKDEIGFKLLANPEFMHVARLATTVTPLVIALDPVAGTTRVMTLEFERALLSRARVLGDGRRSGRVARVTRPWRRAGELDVYMPVGVIGRCERYVLEATAPLDTVFGEARITRSSPKGRTSSLADVSQRSRLVLDLADPDPVQGLLAMNLRLAPTGLARVALLGAWLTALAMTAGFAWVLFAHNHVFFPADAGTGGSLLLLAPGLATVAIAGPAHHRLAASMQYALRLIIWGLAALCLSVAMSAAVRLDGALNVGWWGASACIAWVAVSFMVLRFRVLGGRRG